MNDIFYLKISQCLQGWPALKEMKGNGISEIDKLDILASPLNHVDKCGFVKSARTSYQEKFSG